MQYKKKEPIPIEVTDIFANQITLTNSILMIKTFQISLFCFTFTMQKYKLFFK